MNLTDLVQRVVNQTLRELRVAMPGRVVRYEPERQMVQAEVIQPEVMPDGEVVFQPVIVEVPVSWPRAGGAWLTFPIARGDTGMLVFADRDIGAWVSENDEGDPDSKRTHSLTDAVFVPGIQGGGVNANADDVELQYQGSTIHIRRSGQVEVNAPNVVVNAGQTTINSPTTNNGNVVINGNLNVSGLTTTGGLTSQGTAGGGVATFTGDVVADGTSLKSHTHTDSIGGTTSAPN